MSDTADNLLDIDTTVPTSAPAPANPVTEEIPSPSEPIPTQRVNGKQSAEDAAPVKIGLVFEDDPAAYIKARVESLIYWENPRRSIIFLTVSLGILILTQYYSVLQLLAAFFTLATGANWVYVNTHKQTQRLIAGKQPEDITNPHSQRLGAKGALIPRERVTRAAQLTVDVFEVIARQVTRLILIEDNTRSAIALGVSYFVWTLAKYISTKYLVAFFVISAFSLPRLYLQHQAVIDAHVAHHGEQARVLAKQYGGVASEKAQQLYDQAWAAIKKQPKVQKSD
ncbi:Reticulon-domain-containing protein [Gongronella butleri]|nr:Reticulon-domain-containing protein [Gongronella butleri]